MKCAEQRTKQLMPTLHATWEDRHHMHEVTAFHRSANFQSHPKTQAVQTNKGDNAHRGKHKTNLRLTSRAATPQPPSWPILTGGGSISQGPSKTTHLAPPYWGIRSTKKKPAPKHYASSTLCDGHVWNLNCATTTP